MKICLIGKQVHCKKYSLKYSNHCAMHSDITGCEIIDDEINSKKKEDIQITIKAIKGTAISTIAKEYNKNYVYLTQLVKKIIKKYLKLEYNNIKQIRRNDKYISELEKIQAKL